WKASRCNTLAGFGGRVAAWIIGHRQRLYVPGCALAIEGIPKPGDRLQEMTVRQLLLAALLIFSPVLAFADQSIAGQWRADPGRGVIIIMDILIDGHWASQTVQRNQVVAEMAGTYEQTKTSDTGGKLVFTPVKSKTSAEHGAAQVEEDDYTLS